MPARKRRTATAKRVKAAWRPKPQDEDDQEMHADHRAIGPDVDPAERGPLDHDGETSPDERAHPARARGDE